jgi:hypothetical protein
MVSSAKSNVLSLIFLKSLITDMVFFVCLDDSVYLFVEIVRGVKSAKGEISMESRYKLGEGLETLLEIVDSILKY